MSDQEFKSRAIAAGVSEPLADALCHVKRDAHEHGWMKALKDWTADEQALLEDALEFPDKMAEACDLLMASDGLMNDDGHRFANIADRQRSDIEAFIFRHLRAKFQIPE